MEERDARAVPRRQLESDGEGARVSRTEINRNQEVLDMLYLPSLPAAGAAAALGWRVFSRLEKSRSVRMLRVTGAKGPKGSQRQADRARSVPMPRRLGGRQQNLGVACDTMTPGSVG
jgi:hypothetical protein